MKKQLFNVLLCCLIWLPNMGAQAQSTVVEGQSTEGKDFWVTFMQADQDPNNDLLLSLSISSRENCEVTIANPFTGYSENVTVTANQMQLVELYEGNVLVANARAAMAGTGKVCYAVNSEKVDTCALHVTATANISLFATNYKRATFDATNVLPTASLLDKYIIQTYTPSDHGGESSTQGSHFAVIAAEDNTIVEYSPTVPTQMMNDSIKAAQDKKDFMGEDALTDREKYWLNYKVGDTLLSPVLMKGQVYYVWTGKKDNHAGDLSGTYVKAQDGKKIAVFQGCPHTNIPYQVKQRDHIFSQAMPVQYWGNTFVLTASKSRPVDKIRILALNDETEVRINGDSVYTFNFANNPKRYWEFEIGANGTYGKNGSCLVTTSCPCAVHLFMVSQQYHGDKNSSGDPAMLWVNPIEQQIDQVTFATYASKNGTTDHFVNVVTDQPAMMTLDGNDISAQFSPVDGSTTYHYAQVSLGNTATSHTLKSNGSKFIAHVYGFTSNESYGYSAGGATKPLTQYITINGQIFTPESDNTLCGEDTVKFACHPDYEYEKIEWHFGDGATKTVTSEEAKTDSIIPHYYATSGSYRAYVLIYRESSNLCVGQSAVDSIPITVTIGNYTIDLKSVELPYCTKEGDEANLTINLYNPGQVSLSGDSVSIDFNATAIADGFTTDKLTITNDSTLTIRLPKTAKNRKPYGLQLHIGSKCPESVLDTLFEFSLTFDIPVLTQRYNNVLGLTKDSFPTQELSDFVWFHNGDTIPNAETSVLYLDETNPDNSGEYHVCFKIHEANGTVTDYCTCPIQFKAESKTHLFADDDTYLQISAYYSVTSNGVVFVNADWKGKTDIECYAQWINASGQVYNNLKFNIPDGGCTIPAPQVSTPTLYLLRVYTDGKSRSFKFIINN